MTIVAKRSMMTILLPVLFFLGAAGAVFSEVNSAATASSQHDLLALLNDIGRKVSDFTSLKTDFTQEKQMAMFREKIVFKGRIYLQKPGRIAWHVDSPVRYSVLITDKAIRQWDEDTNKVQETALSKNPLLQNVLNQLTVWFSGEYAPLLATNEVTVKQYEPLVLEFVPLENAVSKKVIKKITLSFREDQKYLKRIQIQEASGDVTTIAFTNTQVNIPLDKSVFEVKR